MKKIPYALIGISLLVIIAIAWFGFGLYTWLYKTSITYRISDDGNIEIVASSTQGERVMSLDLPTQKKLPTGVTISDVVVRAKNFTLPQAVQSLPDGRLIVVERGGGIHTISLDGVVSRVTHAISPLSYGEAGILSLVVDPEFTKNNAVYITYSYKNQAGELFNRVSRFTIVSASSTSPVVATTSTGSVAEPFQTANMRDEVILLDRIPAGLTNNGGMLAIDSKGYLWIATGDAGKGVLAQDELSLGGKLLRLGRDGSIPGSNPQADSPVVARGLRAPVGIEWAAGGLGFVVDEGNASDDKVYPIVAGANYGWPVTAACQKMDERFVDALVCSGATSWKPSGLGIASGVGTTTDKLLLSTNISGILKVFSVTKGTTTPVVSSIYDVLVPGTTRLGGVSVLSGGVPVVWTATKDGKSGGSVDDDKVISFDLP